MEFFFVEEEIKNIYTDILTSDFEINETSLSNDFYSIYISDSTYGLLDLLIICHGMSLHHLQDTLVITKDGIETKYWNPITKWYGSIDKKNIDQVKNIISKIVPQCNGPTISLDVKAPEEKEISYNLFNYKFQRLIPSIIPMFKFKITSESTVKEGNQCIACTIRSFDFIELTSCINRKFFKQYVLKLPKVMVYLGAVNCIVDIETSKAVGIDSLLYYSKDIIRDIIQQLSISNESHFKSLIAMMRIETSPATEEFDLKIPEEIELSIGSYLCESKTSGEWKFNFFRYATIVEHPKHGTILLRNGSVTYVGKVFKTDRYNKLVRNFD